MVGHTDCACTPPEIQGSGGTVVPPIASGAGGTRIHVPPEREFPLHFFHFWERGGGLSLGQRRVLFGIQCPSVSICHILG